MANMIKNNMPSLRTLNQLNKNTNLLTKSLPTLPRKLQKKSQKSEEYQRFSLLFCIRML